MSESKARVPCPGVPQDSLRSELNGPGPSSALTTNTVPADKPPPPSVKKIDKAFSSSLYTVCDMVQGLYPASPVLSTVGQ